MPVLATCAGLILLAEHLSNDERTCFKTLPVTVRRNAYGRQLGSFHAEAEFAGLGPVPMTFIRAPFITAVHPGAQALAELKHGLRAGDVHARHPAQGEDQMVLLGNVLQAVVEFVHRAEEEGAGDVDHAGGVENGRFADVIAQAVAVDGGEGDVDAAAPGDVGNG